METLISRERLGYVFDTIYYSSRFYISGLVKEDLLVEVRDISLKLIKSSVIAEEIFVPPPLPLFFLPSFFRSLHEC